MHAIKDENKMEYTIEEINKDILILSDVIDKLHQSFNELRLKKKHKETVLHAEVLLELIMQRKQLIEFRRKYNEDNTNIVR